MFCEECGEELEDGGDFCLYCDLCPADDDDWIVDLEDDLSVDLFMARNVHGE